MTDTTKKKQMWIRFFEITGSITAIAFALFAASNTNNEFLGFLLLLVSALLFAAWAIIDERWAFLILQLFYIGTAIWGIRNFWDTWNMS